MRLNDKLFGGLVALAISAVCTTASANDVLENRTVAFIRIHNSATVTSQDWFALTGLSSQPGCGTSNGYVVIKMPDRNTPDYAAMLSVLQAAKLADRSVRVVIRSHNLTEGYCTAVYVDL